jgi:transketolase
MLKPSLTVDIRDGFFDELYALARDNPQVLLLTADMGGAYRLFQFKNDLAKQFFNVGIAEQNMVSIAAGLCLGGKKVFIYTIIPFATFRCYEQIKMDLCCMRLPVTIVGAGAGFTYGSDGPTHHATQDIAVMRALPEITIFSPSDPEMIKALVRRAMGAQCPVYIRLDKAQVPVLPRAAGDDFTSGFSELLQGKDLTIFASGIMVHEALAVAEELKKYSLSVGVVDFYCLKPVNEGLLVKLIDKAPLVVSLEENSIVGGMGSIISEVMHDHTIGTPLKRIAIPDEHCFSLGDRETIHRRYEVDRVQVAKRILEWLRERRKG